MIIDGRTVSDGATVEADVCVMGAGAAGITLATELNDGAARVVLLESGGLSPDPVTQSPSPFTPARMSASPMGRSTAPEAAFSVEAPVAGAAGAALSTLWILKSAPGC